MLLLEGLVSLLLFISKNIDALYVVIEGPVLRTADDHKLDWTDCSED